MPKDLAERYTVPVAQAEVNVTSYIDQTSALEAKAESRMHERCRCVRLLSNLDHNRAGSQVTEYTSYRVVSQSLTLGIVRHNLPRSIVPALVSSNQYLLWICQPRALPNCPNSKAVQVQLS